MKERNYGLDICRILAMSGIVILHILGGGGVISAAPAGSINYWVLWFLEIIAFGSVTVFGMLSGYLSVNKKKYSTFRLVELLFTTFCYSLVITIVFFIFNRSVFDGLKSIVISLFPVIKEKYWYITCYTLVFLLMPYLNLLINKLSKQQIKRLTVTLFLAISVVPNIVSLDLFRTEFGYSAIWLITAYVFGACYRKNDKIIFWKKDILFALVCNICMLAIKMIAFYFIDPDFNYMINYSSPFIVIASILFIQFFARTNISLKNSGGRVRSLPSFLWQRSMCI